MKLKSKNINPWVTKGILKSIKRKNLLYKSYVKSPNITNIKKFTTYRNELNHLLRLSKKHYIDKKIKESENNMKETWKIINSLLNKSKGRNNYPTNFLDNNTKDTEYNIIANTFSRYFSNIGSNLAKQIPEVDVNYKSFLQGNYINSLFFKDTTPDEIESITMKLKNKSSYGSDGLSTALVKNVITLISKPLSEIINLSMTKGILPDQMKIAKVIPLFKSGDNNIYKNFRPVSILPSFSKILEKVVYNRLTDYLTKFNILNKNQQGKNTLLQWQF